MPLPVLDIDLPLPQPRTRATLLASIDELPHTSMADDENERWLNGDAWVANTLRDPKFGSTLDACGPLDVNGDAQGLPAPPLTAAGFRVFDGITTSTLNAVTGDALREGLLKRSVNWLSWAFARQLATGSATGASNNLKAAAAGTPPATVPYGSLATPVYNAFAILETHLASKIHNGVGTIHIPPGMLQIAVDCCSLERDGDRYYTQLGNLVVADGGYYSMPAPNGATAAANGEDWIYATGPVFYRMVAPEIVGGELNQVDIRTNDRTMWIEAYGLVVFDPEVTTAVLASYREE